MSRPVLVLDEIVAILRIVGVQGRYIDAFSTHALNIINKRNVRSIETGGTENREEVDTIQVNSGFGMKTQKGLVDLTINDQVTQMEPKKAREVGLFLLEAAEAAMSDEMFIKLLKNVGIADNERLGTILLDLREIRQGTRGTSWPI